MASLGRRSFPAGDKIRYVLDYSRWLEEDMSLTSSTITCDDVNVTISDVAVNPDKTVSFFVETTLSELFTVSIETIDSKTEIKRDRIEFEVVSP